MFCLIGGQSFKNWWGQLHFFHFHAGSDVMKWQMGQLMNIKLGYAQKKNIKNICQNFP